MMLMVMFADVRRATGVLVMDVADLTVAVHLELAGPVAVAEQVGAGCGVGSDRFERAEFAAADARQSRASVLILIAKTACCPQCWADCTHAALADVVCAFAIDVVGFETVNAAAGDYSAVAGAVVVAGAGAVVVDEQLASVMLQTSIDTMTRLDEQHIAAPASRAVVVVALDIHDSTWVVVALMPWHIVVCHERRFAESASRRANCFEGFGSWLSPDMIGG
jgi:hypothetical protein